jgi:fucose 4-O-acetylase-like acetyltransferase
MPSVGTLWFIVCLFAAEIIFFMIIKLIKNIKEILQWIIIIAVCLIGYAISRFVFLPWSTDIALFSQIFIFTGYKLKQKDVFNKKISFNLYALMFFIWIIGCFTYTISMNNREYYNIISPVLCAICGCILFIKCSIFISKFKLSVKVLGYLGQISIIILIFHTFDCWFFHFNALSQLAFIFNSHWIVLFLFKLVYSVIIAEIIRWIPIINEWYGIKNPYYRNLLKKHI